jgi:hypothetical protein
MDTQSLQKTGTYLTEYWLALILLVRKFPAFKSPFFEKNTGNR